MNKLVLDVDGVILNFGEKYLELAKEVLGSHIQPDITKYDLKEFLQVNISEEKKVWDEFNNRDYWRFVNPLEGSVEAIKKINEMNIDVYIVSSIDSSHTNSRLYNLKQVGLIPKEIYCVGDGHAHKHEIVSIINPFAFVDDRLDHLYRSLDVPHLAWVDHSHVQVMEEFNELGSKVKSLNEWVNLHLINIINNNKNKTGLK